MFELHGSATAAAPALGVDALEAARETLRQEAAALAAVAERLDDSFLRAVELLGGLAGSVMVTGMGKSGLVAAKVAATLASTGTRAHFLHPGEAVHGDLGRVGEDDLVLALSHGGETAEVVRLLPSLREQGTPVVAVTGRANGALGRAAAVTLCYGPVEEACPIRMAPSTSCVVMMAVGDALAFALMRQRQFGRRQFEKVHPSGSLGRLLQPVREVMRTGDQLRQAAAAMSVREVFVVGAKPGRRTGALLLHDDQGRLCGLVTDADMARLVERGDWDAFDQPVSRLMARRPLTLRAEQRVADAVAVFRDRQFRISQLPVVDDDGRAVGVVDLTDLADLLPALPVAA